MTHDSSVSQYGDAAVMSLVLEALPSIAAEVAAPLAKTDEIVMIGGQDRTTQEVSKLCGTLPPAISALTGVDVSGVSVDSVGSVGSVSPPPVTTQPRPVRTISQNLNVGPLHLH